MDGVQVLSELSELSELNYKGFVMVISSVSAPVLKSVERLASELQLNFLGTVQKPYDEHSLAEIFDNLQQNKEQKKHH